MAPCLGQRPISENTHQLYWDWEQHQVELIKEPGTDLDPNADEVQLFVLPEAGRSCSAYRAKLVGASVPLQESSFAQLGGSCSVRLESPAGVQPALVVSAIDGLGSRLVNAELAPTTREIAISFQRGLFGEEVGISHWPLRTGGSWWRAAVDWLPGVDPGEIPDRVQRLQRPVWRVIRESCFQQEKSSEIVSALFALLRTVEVTDYTVEEMRVLAACAITHGWGRTAQRAIDHWESLSGITQDLVTARLRLAALQFRVGDYRGVSDLSISPSRPIEEMQYRHLKSMALLALSRYPEAAALLLEGPHLGGASSSSVKILRSAMYMRYNLATALMASGEPQRAWAVLDRIGQTKSNDLQIQALVDKANLVLGWQFLNANSAATATPIFGRVATDGPYTSQALLGIGWSWLSERGKAQRRVAEPTSERPAEQSSAVLKALFQHGEISCDEYREAMGDAAVCLRSTRFRRRAEQADDYRASTASDYWLRLLRSDLSDLPSVEAAIALADSAAAKGQLGVAKALLSRCIQFVEGQLKQLSVTATTLLLDDVGHPQWLQLWLLDAEPHLLLSMYFALEQPSVEAEMHPDMLRQRRALRLRVQKQLVLIFEEQREKRRDQLNSYLIDARFKYARMLDLAREVESP